MKHATILREQACALFAGPHAAKRMAQGSGWRLTACQDYLCRRRQLSLDAAIELAGRNEAALALLLQRVQAVRDRHAAAANRGSDSGAAAAAAVAVSAEPRA